MDLGKERLGPYLTTIITPLYRELDSTYADQGNCSESVCKKKKRPENSEITLQNSYTLIPLNSLSVSRSHAEEPGTGADRAAEETSGAAEILSGLLCCSEGVLTEASCTQTTQSHAGRMDNQSAHTHTIATTSFIFTFPFCFTGGG